MPSDVEISAADYHQLGSHPSATRIFSLAAVALVSGIANGYNGFVLEGALPRLHALVDTEIKLSVFETGVIGGALSLGGFIGSLACTEIAYRLSRRHMVVVGEAVIIASVLAFACASSFMTILIGRIATGFGVGICGLAKPLIVSEQSPPHMRGLLVSLFAVGQSIGLNIFYITDWALPPLTVAWAWRVLVALGATPAIVVVGLALSGAAPASAYWDVPPSRVVESAAGASIKSEAPHRQLVALLTVEPREVRRNFGLVLALMLGYNLSGTLVIANYAGEIFASAGAAGRDLPIVVGVVQFLGLLSAAAFSDRLGRRPLLLMSCALTAACLYLIAVLIGNQTVLAPALGGVFTPALLTLIVAVEYAVGAGLNPIRIVLSAELMPNKYRSLGMALGNAVGWGLALVSLFLFPVLTKMLGGPAPQFAFFGSTVALLTLLLVWQLPETRGIDFG